MSPPTPRRETVRLFPQSAIPKLCHSSAFPVLRREIPRTFPKREISFSAAGQPLSVAAKIHDSETFFKKFRSFLAPKTILSRAEHAISYPARAYSSAPPVFGNESKFLDGTIFHSAFLHFPSTSSLLRSVSCQKVGVDFPASFFPSSSKIASQKVSPREKGKGL